MRLHRGDKEHNREYDKEHSASDESTPVLVLRGALARARAWAWVRARARVRVRAREEGGRRHLRMVGGGAVQTCDTQTVATYISPSPARY